MDLITAVVKELADFAIGSLFVQRDRNEEVWDKNQAKLPLGGVLYESAAGDGISYEQKAPAAVQEPEHRTISPAPQKNTVVYVQSTDAALRKGPEIGTDNIIIHIPYGSMLVALESYDGWIRAFHHGTEGWIALEDIADRAAHVHPHFRIGEKNLADDPNTARVRALIRDEFCYGETDMPLQAEEYVLYKLYRRGAKLEWGAVRPRTPGRWEEILARTGSSVSSRTPSQRAVMEWKVAPDAGHLAYVEAVFPDESIQLSEANWPDGGIYNERVMVKEEWQPLNPVFLTIT